MPSATRKFKTKLRYLRFLFFDVIKEDVLIEDNEENEGTSKRLKVGAEKRKISQHFNAGLLADCR